LLTTLSPVRERARGYRHGWQVVVFGVGAVSSGLVLGAALLGLSIAGQRIGVPPSAAPVALALASVVDLRASANWVMVRRQLNEALMYSVRPWAYCLAYGIQLGALYATYYTTAAILALPLVAASSPPGPYLLASGVLVGLIRMLHFAFSILLTDLERVRRTAAVLVALRRPTRVVGGLLVLALAISSAATLGASALATAAAVCLAGLLVGRAPSRARLPTRARRWRLQRSLGPVSRL
jgi:hypothetical protein